MMRLARIVCVASDLGPCVRSLPRPCKSVQASSNASQIVRVLLKLNASGFSTMTQSPHARYASVRERRDGSGLKAGRFAMAARSLEGYGRHSRKSSYSFVTIRKLLTGCGARMPLTGAEYRRVVVSRGIARAQPPKASRPSGSPRRVKHADDGARAG